MNDQSKTKPHLIDRLTELRRQVATLKESEKKYRSLFNDALDMIHVVDKNGKIIDANKTELKTLGYSEEEFIGKHLTEIIHPEYLETTKKALKQVFSGKEIRGHETVLMTRDGTNIDVEVNAVPEIVDGKVISAKGILRDVTERKQSEAETLRLAKFPSKNPNPVLRISKDGSIDYHNRSSAPLLKLGQYQEGQYLKGKWREIILKALKTGKDQRTEAEYGKRVYSLTFAPVLDSEFVNVYGLDITERTQAEETRKNSERWLSILFEFAPDAYYLNDLRGNFIDGNKAAEKITGYKKEELIGKNFLNLKLLRLDQIPKAAESLVKNALGKPTGPDEFTLIRKDGDRVGVEISTYPVEIKNKTVVLSIARDITERKRAEEALRKERDIAQQYLDLAGVMFVAINTKGEVTLINKKGCEILGYSEEEIVGKNWFDNFLPKRLLDQVKPVSEKLLAGELETTEYFENPILTKQGEEKLVAWHNILLKDETGNIIGHLSSGEDITERKQAEEKAEKLMHDIGERYKELNLLYKVSGYSTESGLSLEDVLQKTVDSIPPAWHYPKITCARIVLEAKEFKTKNFKKTKWEQSAVIKVHGKKSGTVDVFYLEEMPELDKDPFLKEEGELINTLSRHLGNITERLQAEEKLQDSNERYRSLVETTSDWIWEVDQNLVYTYVNPRVKDLLGYEPEEVIGKTLFDLMPPDETERVAGLFRNIVEGRKPFKELENINLHKDGRRVILVTGGVPILDLSGNLLGYRGIDYNITGRKEAEEALRDSEEKYRSLFSCIADPVMIFDKETYQFLDCNNAVQTVYGYSEEEFKGMKPFDLHPPEELDEVKRNIDTKNVDEPNVYRHITKDGQIMDAEILTNEIAYQGRPAWLSVVRDITTRKQAEEQIKKDLKEKQVLLKEIHHRVKNNLQIISSLLGLQEKHIKDKEVLDIFKESKNRIRSMALVHEELYRSGDFANIDFTKYIHELVDRIRQTYIMEPDRIEFKVKVKDVFLGIDHAIPCGLVINELISNALKHAFRVRLK